MAVRKKDELLSAIRTRLGEDTSDEAISLIEDFHDTLNDYDSRVGEDWKSKYEENDKTWRQKYRDRFFQSPSKDEGETTPAEVVSDNAEDLETEGEEKSFDSLFTERSDNSGY